MLRRTALCFVLAALAASFAVAGSASAAESCPNATIRSEQGSEYLKNCRAYEKVSSEAKNGFDAIPRSGVRSSSPSGDRVTFNTFGVAPGAASGGVSQILAIRDAANGWTSEPIDPPSPANPPGTITTTLLLPFQGFSSSLTKGVVNSLAPLTAGAALGSGNLFVRDLEDGSYELASPSLAPTYSTPGEPNVFDGASSDFEKLIFESPRTLTDDTPAPSGVGVPANGYEYVDGNLSLIGILPDGSPAPGGAVPGSGRRQGSIEHAISADGSRVFFHTIEPGATDPTVDRSGQLYVREDGTTTIHISASQRTDCADHDPCTGSPEPDPAGPLPALFLTAEAVHGDKVLFSSCEKLTDDSTADSSNPACATQEGFLGVLPGSDLYLYDLQTGDMSDLTTADPTGSELLGILGASDDLSRVYFVAGGVLAPNTGALGSLAQPGQPNLYLWDEGDLRYIATLDPSGGELEDAADWSVSQSTKGKMTKVRVTPDGDHLLFSSQQALTGFDNTDPACALGRCNELFIYDAATDELHCISCSDGQPATGDAQLANGSNDSSDPLARNMRDDGDVVYFETPDPLVNRDVNGRVDVYEWSLGNGVSLITSGVGPTNSLFLDATPSGSDVFFTTGEQLIGSDRDALRDVYDARVDGGFSEPAPKPEGCLGDACREAAPEGLSPPRPSSVSFSGSPNPDSHRTRKKHHRRKQHHRKHTHDNGRRSK